MGTQIYFVLEVQNDNAHLFYRFADDDPGATSSAYDRAIVKFHEVMAYRHENRESTLGVIMDITGGVLMRERYVKQPFTPPNNEEVNG